MKRKILGMAALFTVMCIFPVFAQAKSAPTLETTNLTTAGQSNFFANGTAITIDERTDGQAGAKITWSGGSMLIDDKTHVFGGSHESDTTIETTNIVMNGGTIRNLIGGGLHKSYVKEANITVNGGEMASIDGAGASSASWTTCHRPWHAGTGVDAINKVDVVNLEINGGKSDAIFAGNEGIGYTGEINMLITGGTWGWVTAAGSNGYTKESTVAITGGKIKVFQGVNRGKIDVANVVVAGGEIETYYIGGETTDGNVDGTLGTASAIILGGKVGKLEPGTSGGTGTNNEINVDQNNIVAVYASGTVTTDSTNASAAKISLVSLDKTSLKMVVGDKTTLNATLNPADFSNNALIIWDTSDEGIVTVDDEGNLVATGKGTAKISATLGDKTIDVDVTVTEKAAATDTVENPETFDGILFYVALALIGFSGVLGTTTYIKKRFN